MNKICTSIEQSQKLIESGIDVNTADMYWFNGHIDLTETKYKLFVINRSNKHIDFFNSHAVAVESNEIIPAWSLAALLEYLRKHDLFPEIKDADDCILMDMTFYDGDEVVGKAINPIHFIRVEGKNILDACYGMILKLHEFNLL